MNRREKRPWDNSGLEYLKVRKFKIEPYGTNVGFYSIDGEVDCYLNKVNLKKKNWLEISGQENSSIYYWKNVKYY